VRVAITIKDADVDLFEHSLALDSRLGKRVSTAQFDIEGEERLATPSLAIANTPAIGGYTLPAVKDEVKIDRGAAPFVNCAIAPIVAMKGNSTYLDNFFGGYIASVEIGLTGVRRYYHCTAQDYNSLTTQILVTKSYAAKTAKQIIDDLFTAYLSEIDTSEVEDSVATITIDWTRIFLDKALDELADIFEREWYIAYDKKLQFFTPVTTAAPFELSDSPALSTKIPYGNFRHAEDASRIINKVTVIGDTSVPIVVTRTDAASYALYGRYFEAKVVDNNIDTVAWANLVGDAVLTESANAKVRGRLTCEQEGLIVGQKVKVTNGPRDIDDYYLIQSVRLAVIGGLTEKVDIEYGDYSPQLVDLLMKIKNEAEKE